MPTLKTLLVTLFLTLGCLAVLVLFFFWNVDSWDRSAPRADSTAPSVVRIMPLGDSITQAAAGSHSYRYFLWKKLTAAGYQVDFVGSQSRGYRGRLADPNFDQDHEGHWGYRVDHILKYLPRWAAAVKPDIVLIHLGSNDILQGQDLAETIDEMNQVIDQLQAANPAVKILLAQIIPAVAGRVRLKQYNAALAELAVQRNQRDQVHAPIIIVDQWRDIDLSTDLYDGLHPNTTGERKLAARWFEPLSKILN